jgi:hypothetical protein
VTKTILLAFLAAISVAGVQAQEQPENRRWTITSTLTTGTDEALNCTVAFPVVEGIPQLRLSMAAKNSSTGLNFDLRGVGALAENDRDKVAGVNVRIGSRVIDEELEGTWRDLNEGRLTFRTKAAGVSLLEPVARALTMDVSVDRNTYSYDLTGSRRAVAEWQKCLR